MERKKNDKIMSLLLNSAAALVLIGAFFKLQHYPYGNIIFWGGFIFGTIAQSFEIHRLKKVIKLLENTDSKSA